MNELLLFGVVGEEITSAQVAAQLQAMRGGPVLVRLNSPGGGVFEGQAIASLLAQHPHPTACRIEGLCASIATMIALACGRVVASSNAMLMVHRPTGDAPEDLLAKIEGQMVAIYMRRSGAAEATVRKWMADETWFTPEEALDAKLIDEIGEPIAITARFDLQKFGFKRIPEILMSTPAAPNPTTPTIPTAEAFADLSARLKTLEAENLKLRTADVTRRVEAAIAERRIPMAVRKSWIDRAVADPKALDELAAYPQQLPGEEPFSEFAPQGGGDEVSRALAAHKRRLKAMGMRV